MWTDVEVGYAASLIVLASQSFAGEGERKTGALSFKLWRFSICSR
jgi:hypothetical protein